MWEATNRWANKSRQSEILQAASHLTEEEQPAGPTLTWTPLSPRRPQPAHGHLRPRHLLLCLLPGSPCPGFPRPGHAASDRGLPGPSNVKQQRPRPSSAPPPAVSPHRTPLLASVAQLLPVSPPRTQAPRAPMANHLPAPPSAPRGAAQPRTVPGRCFPLDLRLSEVTQNSAVAPSVSQGPLHSRAPEAQALYLNRATSHRRQGLRPQGCALGGPAHAGLVSSASPRPAQCLPPRGL